MPQVIVNNDDVLASDGVTCKIEACVLHWYPWKKIDILEGEARSLLSENFFELILTVGKNWCVFDVIVVHRHMTFSCEIK